jgi:hypothetical protein
MVVSQLHRPPRIVSDFLGKDPDGVVERHLGLFDPIVVRNTLDRKSKNQIEQEQKKKLFGDWFHERRLKILAKYSI